jgi:hypothetical protein
VKKIAILFLAVFLSACAATGPIYQPAPPPAQQDALVYIYRTDGFVLGARDAYFYVNDFNIIDLSNQGYTWFHVPAGNHTLKQKWPFDVSFGLNTLRINKEHRPSQTYYYRLEIGAFPGMFAMFGYNWSFTEVSEEQARADRI